MCLHKTSMTFPSSNFRQVNPCLDRVMDPPRTPTDPTLIIWSVNGISSYILKWRWRWRCWLVHLVETGCNSLAEAKREYIPLKLKVSFCASICGLYFYLAQEIKKTQCSRQSRHWSLIEPCWINSIQRTSWPERLFFLVILESCGSFFGTTIACSALLWHTDDTVCIYKAFHKRQWKRNKSRLLPVFGEDLRDCLLL